MGILDRRRQWMVDRRQQLPFLRHVAVHAVLVVAVTAAFVIHATQLVRGAASVSPQFEHEVLTSSVSFGLRALLVVVVVVLLEALLALRFSARLAGPSRRLRQILDEIGGGNTSQRTSFRHGDALRALEEPLNHWVAGVDDFESRVRAEVPALTNAIAELKLSVRDGDPPANLRDVRALCERIRALAEFGR